MIGTKTLRYDMWGPDVLVANQIEENGQAGRILVSEEARLHLQKCADVALDYHKDITLKGGEAKTMRTHLLQ